MDKTALLAAAAGSTVDESKPKVQEPAETLKALPAQQKQVEFATALEQDVAEWTASSRVEAPVFPKTPVVTFDPDAVRQAQVSPRPPSPRQLRTVSSSLAAMTPSTREAYSTNLRFWTVWRVLGVMFLGIAGGVVLAILSLVAVFLESWSEATIGIINLSLMTVICFLLTAAIFFSFARWWRNRSPERTVEQRWVIVLAIVCWIQPYLNPIALGFRWSAVTSDPAGLQAERGYTIQNPRISGFSSTVLVTVLYAFCFYEIRRFRDEEFPNQNLLVSAYFIIRMSFTQALGMDFGCVPVAALFTLFRDAPTLSNITPTIAARIAGIVLVSVIDAIVWVASIVYHRNTRARIMRRLHDANDRAHAVQYGLSVVTTALWTTQIVFGCLIIACTAPPRLRDESLTFLGTSVNTVGCCCAFLLTTWLLALAFAHFPLRAKDSSKGRSRGRRKNNVRVRFYNFEREVPPWAVLIVNGRRCVPLSSGAQRPLSLERQSSTVASLDAKHSGENRSLSKIAKNILTNSINAVGEAMAADGSNLILDPSAKGGTVVNFVLEHACICLNFANIAYNTGNFDKPQTNAQVQKLVEDNSYRVHRQVSSPQLDVHAIVFVSKQRVIVSFRGTHSSKNIRTDAAFHWKEHLPSTDWAFDLASPWAKRFTPKIHAGFRKAYATIRLPLLSCLEDLLREDPSRACWLCGHSMGGSLACLFAFDVRKKVVSDPTRITVFTYGSSRLGNESFRARYNDAVPQTFSLVCCGDPVSKLPPRFPFGLPLGYKHHGVAVMLLPNGLILARPSRADMAILHTYAPNDWNSHRVRAYAQAMMKWCVLQGIESELRPFWNSIVTQVHSMPMIQLGNSHLLRYMLEDDAKAIDNKSSKEKIAQALTDALVRKPFVNPSGSEPPLEIFVSVSSVRLPNPRQAVFASARSPMPNRKHMLPELRMNRSKSNLGHGNDNSATAGLSPSDEASSLGRAQALPSDVVYVVVSCGSTEGEEAVDAPEHSSAEVTCGTQIWVGGLERVMSFGGAVQTLRPELDRLSLRVFRRATECSCESGLIAKLTRLPSAASFAIHSNLPGASQGLALETNHSGVCEACATPVCIAASSVAVSSFFSDLATTPEKELILPAALLHGPSKENAIIKLRVWDSREGKADTEEKPLSPKKGELTGLRTYAPTPCYDSFGLPSSPASALFPRGFVLRVRLVKAIGAPYRSVKSAIYRLSEALSGGVSCKMSMPNTFEKFFPSQKESMRKIVFTSPQLSQGFGSSFAVAAARLMPGTASIIENLPSVTAGVSTQKALEVQFEDEIFMFGARQPLTGFEEIIIRVRGSRSHSRLWLRRPELGGFAVCELHRLLRQLEAEPSREETETQEPRPLMTARWYSLRGPGACGRVLLAFEFLPNGQIQHQTSSQLAAATDFADAEEDLEVPTLVSSPPLRLGPRLTSASTSSARASRFSLEIVLCGLRHLPTHFERVAVSVQVRDEYNPRQGVRTRTDWIEHSGVVHGWAMQPQRLALGFDPTTSLDGYEEIVLRVVDAHEATIAKRAIRIRDLLAEFAETDLNIELGQKSSSLVSLLAWFVLPYKIKTIQGSARAPEVKVMMRIADTEFRQSSRTSGTSDVLSLV